MPASKVVDLIYPKENLRHKDIPLPDFGKIHEQMVQMGKHADLSFLWIDYKKEHPNGYQLAQFYKLYRDFMVDKFHHLQDIEDVFFRCNLQQPACVQTDPCLQLRTDGRFPRLLFYSERITVFRYNVMKSYNDFRR